MELNVAKLREDIVKMTAYYPKEMVGALEEIMCVKWQSLEGMHYPDMLSWIEIEYGRVARMLIMFSRYGGQVCNGGHMQYFENGYASDGGGCFDKHDTSCKLHRRMLRLMDELHLNTTELGKQIEQIAREFLHIAAKDEAHDYDDDEEYQDPYDNLDGRYYAINEAWDAYLDKYLADWLDKGVNPIPAPVEVPVAA